ncbi:Polymerase/histidinol phosphatase-like protein [Syncephalis fuscata]|nr:Polymerase/histidinol phosphatase-like protein [Syncephalis fuscata]
MPFTLHTHSGQFCYHAQGTLEQIVEAGIKANLLFIGLSEHMPRCRSEDLYPEEKDAEATPQQLVERFDAYVHEARRLRHEYKDQIYLSRSAFEVEVLREKYQLDYIIGSVHHVHGHPIDFNAEMLAQAQAMSGTHGTADELVLDYFKAQFAMLKALEPEVIGHIDLIRRLMPADTEWSPAVWQQIRENAQFIASYGGLVEINTAAWKYNLLEPYPRSAVIKILQEEGCLFTLSDDAHQPSHIGAFHNHKLRDYLATCQIHTIYGLETVATTETFAAISTESLSFSRVRPVAYTDMAFFDEIRDGKTV